MIFISDPLERSAEQSCVSVRFSVIGPDMGAYIASIEVQAGGEWEPKVSGSSVEDRLPIVLNTSLDSGVQFVRARLEYPGGVPQLEASFS